MYAVPNKTQHRLIVKVGGGISQKLDNITSPSSIALQSVAFSSVNSTNSSPAINLPPVKELPFARHVDEIGFDAELSHSPQPIFRSVTEKHGNKSKSSANQMKNAQRQNITAQHQEMIKYVQQSWKGVERDYKRSVTNVISNLDINNSSSQASKPKQTNQKKPGTFSTPLLLSGSYHHTCTSRDSTTNRQDSFQPFDLEAFWGDRILKRLTS